MDKEDDVDGGSISGLSSSSNSLTDVSELEGKGYQGEGEWIWGRGNGRDRIWGRGIGSGGDGEWPYSPSLPLSFQHLAAWQKCSYQITNWFHNSILQPRLTEGRIT